MPTCVRCAQPHDSLSPHCVLLQAEPARSPATAALGAREEKLTRALRAAELILDEKGAQDAEADKHHQSIVVRRLAVSTPGIAKCSVRDTWLLGCAGHAAITGPS